MSNTVALYNQDYEQTICDNHNNAEGELNLKDGYNCPICKNKGNIAYLGKNGKYTLKSCECTVMRNAIRNLKASGLNDLLKTCTFDRFETPQPFQKGIKELALEFCKSNGRCFFIGGQSGCGKTHICTAIMSDLMKNGKSGNYLKWREVVTLLKSVINETEYQTKMNSFKKVKILYIDDLFKVQKGQNPTSADVNIAFELLDSRLSDSNLITLISSEFSITELIEIDEATGGRIYEHAGNFGISIDKDSTRNYRLNGK